MAGHGRIQELRNELSWSHSRYETFRECPRRYFYHYYGSWGGWQADADPLTRRLYLLKQLKNRYLWAGSIVHDAVAGVLSRTRAGLPAQEPKQVADDAIARMRTEFRASRNRAYLDDPRKSIGLLEHHYTEPVTDSQWLAMADMVRRSIEGFFSEDWLSRVSQMPAQDWLALEELLDFNVDGGRVYVKMDLAFRRPDGGLTIVDWKTGKRAPRPEGLQLGAYALYAVETWRLPPETIQVVEVNLATRSTGSAAVTNAHIAAARDTIRDAFQEMRAVLFDVENNIARIEDFAPRLRSNACSRCPFREVCPPSQDALAAGAADAARAG